MECVDDGCTATLTALASRTAATRREQYAEWCYKYFVKFVLAPDDTDIIALARQHDRHLPNCPCDCPECRSVTQAPPPPDPDDDPYDTLMRYGRRA